MAFKTPHSTVRKRKIQTDLHPEAGKRRKDHVARQEVCGDIATKRWSCLTISPLHKFNYDDSELNKYSDSLSSYLLANVGGSLSLDMSFPRADVSIVKGLAIRTDEPHAIKINVSVERGKNVLEVYLCSVDVSQQFPTKSSTFLPLLLYAGQKSYFLKVSSWLETSFACYVKPIKLSAIDLRWMVTLWTSIQGKEEGKQNSGVTEFVWEISDPDFKQKKIKCSLEQPSVLDIWKRVKRSSSEQHEVSLADVDYFMAFLSRHLKKATLVNFDALKLIGINVPFVHIDFKGKVKISSTAHVHTVLAHLCCLAAERVFPFRYDDG